MCVLAYLCMLALLKLQNQGKLIQTLKSKVVLGNLNIRNYYEKVLNVLKFSILFSDNAVTSVRN